MESNSEASCISDPNFAVICSFLERFAKSCGIAHPPFLDLQEMLEKIDEVPQELIDLHIILLRKAKRSVFREKWEKALVKFCQIYSAQDGWEIERFGYKNSRLEVKLRVLKNLLEGQFDLNCKFKSIINTHESNDLRSKPVGKDKSGRIYWLQIDPISNIRVYREDLDEESWTLVAKDRETLVQLLQELTVDEEPVDVNLLNEDSSVSVDIEKTILDTGQESGISDVVTNGDSLTEEKDPLEIKTGETMINDVGYDDCYTDVLNDVGKRVSEDLFPEGDFKKVKLDNGENDMDVGEAIDDPVMHIYGEGSGAECDAGNPDKEEHKTNDANTSSNTSDQSESGQTTSADVKKLDLETKPQPKLWSIDTICGTGFNHSGESSKTVKSVQKNFSSFSIESVLEKKNDSNHSSSPVPESPVISVSAVTANDPAPGITDQASEQIASAGDSTLEKSESQPCNEGPGGISSSEEGISGKTEDAEKPASCENETVSVPNLGNRTNDEDSTAYAENAAREKQTDAADQTHDDNLKASAEGASSIDQEVPDSGTHFLESSREDVHTDGESVHVPSKSEVTLKVESGSLDPIQSPEVRETGSEYMESVDSDQVKGESSVIKSEISEIPPEEVEETKHEMSEIEGTAEKLLPDKDEVKADEGAPDEPEEKCEEMITQIEEPKEKCEGMVAKIEEPEEKCEEMIKQIEEPQIVEEPEKVNEKTDSQALDGEKVEPLLEMNDIGQKPNQVAVAEEKGGEDQSEKQSGIAEDLLEGKEVSENLEEPTGEEKPCETSQEVAENAGNISEEVTISKEPDPSGPGSLLTSQENTGIHIPEEKFEMNEPVKEELGTAKESQVCGEVEDDHVPECTPPVDENIQNPIPELTEASQLEKGDDEATSEALTADEKVRDDDVLEARVCSEVKTETDLPEKMDVDEIVDVKSEAPEIPCQDSADPGEEPGAIPLTEEVGKEEIAKSEEKFSNDPVAEAELKEKEEENCQEPSQILSGELKEEKEPPASEDVKEESAEEVTIKPEDNETPKEEDEAKAQPGKGRKRRRSRKQSGDVMPARATRSATKSLDEDVNTFQELPIKKETRKRKSQDSDNVDLEKMPEPGQAEEAPAVEAEEKKVEERRNSTVSAVSDESSVVAQEQVREGGGKRKKVRKKKGGRKSREEKQESSEDEKKAVEEGESAANEEEKKKKAPKTKAKDGTPRTRQLIPERELKLLGISNMEELPMVRQSRRIAQLKLKEEAERKKLEEAAREEAKKEKKKKKKKKKLSKPSAKKRKSAAATGEESYEEDGGGGDDDEDAESKRKDKKKKKKKDKLVFNELNPWISSSGSSSADEEDEEIDDEAHEEEEILFKSDHEFSPESDIEDPDYKPIKRARTAKVDPKDATEADSKYDDTACEKCGEKDHPEWILLCDKCDKGWHASCVRPALMVVPEGDWFCPPCEHASLIQKLRESLVEYDRCQKQRENEELRRKRLAFVGISLDNVLPSKKEKKPKPVVDNEGESEETASENGGEDSSSSGSSSSDASSSGESSEPVYQLRERRANVTSYRYNEYDELIKSALQEEMEAAKGVGLGKGKDISNQAEGYEEGVEEAVAGEDGTEERNVPADVSVGAEAMVINPQIPRDILEAKPRLKSKKEKDEDYEVESDAEEDDDYNEEENGDAEEEDEELGDEVPPVVPRYDKKKKKTRSLNVRGLDFTSDEEEEDNSDSDFKGESSEEESEYSLPSESESSDGIRRKHKSFDGPLRRSTRARTARYDKEFINDDSEDEAPKKKRSRNVWVESESSDSDRSWGKRKKRSTRGGNRSTMPKKKTKSKAKKKKSKKKSGDSDYEDEAKSKKSRNRKVKYGGLDEPDEEQVLARRTRGKKINYQEMNASDSEEEVLKRRPRVIGDSDEEFVAEKEKSGDSDAEDDVAVEKSEANGKAVSKKSILRKIKKKRPKVIPDPDDFSEEDLLEDEELDEFAEELEDLDEEEEHMLQEMLNDGDVPIRELKEALAKLKERRKEKTEEAKPYPPIPEHMENPGLSPRFPRIGKMKPAPNRSELAAQLGLPAEPALPGIRTNPGVLLGNLPKDEDRPESVLADQQGNMMMLDQPKTDPKEGLMNLQPPPYPFPAEGPSGVPPLVNAHAFPLNNRPPAPPYSSFQGMIPPPTRLPPEYPHGNIPTTVLGMENESLQDVRKQGQKPATNNKRKNEDGLSPQPDSGEENSGDVRIGDSVDSPKRRGRGRGKKQLLAEAQGKQDIAMSTVQAPTQFPPRGPGPEGGAAGSVITRMLNTPQAPQPFPPDFNRGRSFRPPFPNSLRPPLNPPSPSPLRASSSLAAPPSLPLFHVTLPLDIPPSSIGLPQGKPSQLPPGFPARPPVLPRYPSDPSIRPPFPSHTSSPRGEGFPYPNFYPGPFPPPIPNNEDFHNPNFPNHPFDEHSIPGAAGAMKPPFEEEAGGEFGGLASYFASQREDDLDT